MGYQRIPDLSFPIGHSYLYAFLCGSALGWNFLILLIRFFLLIYIIICSKLFYTHTDKLALTSILYERILIFISNLWFMMILNMMFLGLFLRFSQDEWNDFADLQYINGMFVAYFNLWYSINWISDGQHILQIIRKICLSSSFMVVIIVFVSGTCTWFSLYPGTW